MLDDAGFKDATITASNDLDEFLIASLKMQGQKLQIGVLVLILLPLKIAHLLAVFINLQLLWKTEKTLHLKLNFQTIAKNYKPWK